MEEDLLEAWSKEGECGHLWQSLNSNMQKSGLWIIMHHHHHKHKKQTNKMVLVWSESEAHEGGEQSINKEAEQQAGKRTKNITHRTMRLLTIKSWHCYHHLFLTTTPPLPSS